MPPTPRPCTVPEAMAVTSPPAMSRPAFDAVGAAASERPHALQEPRVGLEALATRWQRALDAAEYALVSAAVGTADPSLGGRRAALVRERRDTAELIASVAREAGIAPVPWLLPVAVSPALLGLDRHVRACVFDLDGVLTNSDALHAEAWAAVFEEFLFGLCERTGRHIAPFDRDVDYRLFVDGRTRVEAIHRFLESRGIEPGAATAWGLARRKGEVTARGLHRPGVAARAGARRYLEAAGRAGLGRVVVSASASTAPMLELAALADVVDAQVDAEVITSRGLRSRPAPDLLLDACSRLDVSPSDAVAFTHSPDGVVAGRGAGLHVVGVASGEQAERLRGFGAERVVPALAALLDPRLAAVGTDADP